MCARFHTSASLRALGSRGKEGWGLGGAGDGPGGAGGGPGLGTMVKFISMSSPSYVIGSSRGQKGEVGEPGIEPALRGVFQYIYQVSTTSVPSITSQVKYPAQP